MRSGGRKQTGAMMLVVVLVIMVIALTALVNMTGELVASAGRRTSATEATLTRIQKALILFTATHKRLPCPARPSGATNPGWPDDVSPLALPAGSTCLYPAGVIPWNALGMSLEEVADEWGRLISYRVYDGTVGLIQENGASAIYCDTDNSNAQNVEPTTAGLCNNQGGKTDTLRSHFVTYTSFGTTPSFDKGLKVNDFGSDANVANVNNVAFVLISHGPSGLGGYSSGGAQTPAVSSTADYVNTQASPSFFLRKGASAADVSPGASGHYDDVVSYLKISDLLTLAEQDARDWPEVEETPTFTAATTSGMTSASTDPTAPHFMSTSGTAADQAFTAVDSGTGVQSPLAAGSFASCLWWPGKLTLISGTTRKALITYLQFAATDNTGDPLSGFTQGFIAGTSAVTTTGSGTAGTATVVVASNSGISAGMTALGSGIATGAKVSTISGTTITLTANNTGVVSGTITFGAPTNAICGTTVEATVTATGAAGQRNLVVSSTTGIAEGQTAFGNGIPFNARVSTITGSGAGATVRLNVDTISAVSGSVDFSNGLQVRQDMGWAGGTLASYLKRFAVEFDATRDSANAGPPAVATANDPSRPHLAVDRTGVVHGTSAGSCTTTGVGLECDSEISALPSVTKSASGSSGFSTITITDSGGMYGIVHGMSVSGTGVPSSTTVTGISGSVVTLSKALTGSVSSVTFGSLSTTNLMQNGLSVYHNARVEVSPRDCFVPSATGTSAQSSLTVTDASMIQSGMSVFGLGIGAGATVAAPFQINLSATNSQNFTGPVTISGGGSTFTLTATGVSGQASLSVSSVAGITSGMSVTGDGVGGGATVQSVQVNLSAANWTTVNTNAIFAGASAISTSGTGTSGSTTLEVSSASGIAPGMTVLGTGLATGVKVSTISGTTVTLSAANAGTVQGTVKFVPERTFVKGWTLTNAGCNLDSALCTAMANTGSKLSYAGSSGLSTGVTGSAGANTITVSSATGIVRGMAVSGTGIASSAYVTGISGFTITLSASNTSAVSGIARFDNRQILHTVSCIPAATEVNAYDALYFGLTTSSRTTGAAVSQTGSGTSGSNQVTLSSTTGILVGMAVRGAGIGDGAVVTAIDSSTIVSLSVANSGTVSGTVSFAGGANLVFKGLNAVKVDLP